MIDYRENVEVLSDYKNSRLIIEGYYVVARLTNNMDLVNDHLQLFTPKDIVFLDAIVIILQGKPLKEMFCRVISENIENLMTIEVLSTIFVGEVASKTILELVGITTVRFLLLPAVIISTKYGNRLSIEILLKYMEEENINCSFNETILEKIISYGNICTITKIVTDYLRYFLKPEIISHMKEIALRIATENTDVRMIKLIQNVQSSF